MKYRYYVVVNDPQYKAAVHTELVSDRGTEFVPARRVAADNPMRHSEYNGCYMLTPEEAQQLQNDPRVNAVERVPEDIGISLRPMSVMTAQYNKTTTLANTHRNWGLVRSSSRAEPYGAATNLTTFNYNLDGTGVDVVIMDSGVLKYHPEMSKNPDGTGGTRYVDINWSQFGIIANNGSGSWQGDLDGHGSHCAGIAAGITCGWAKGSQVYGFNVLDPNNTTTYVSPLLAFQTVRAWHNAKPVNPETGYKRPTVVSMSFGYELTYSSMVSTTWRGTTYNTTGPASAYGQVSADGSAPLPDSNLSTHGYRSPSLEAEIQSCIDAGIIMVGAAGNQAIKVDVPGGIDYDNYYTDSFGDRWYYHRGTTPSATSNVICVGSISYSTPEHKVSYSNTGPRVDVFAPGLAIASAYINQTEGGNAAVVDPRSTASTSSVTTSFYLQKIGGTSMACPQVTGVVACLLQSRPWYTQWQVSQWIKENATTGLLDETFYGGSGYTQYGGLQGAGNRILYQPFNDPNPWSISSTS